MDILPIEVIEIIFNHLSFYEIINQIFLSKKYKKIIENVTWRIQKFIIILFNKRDLQILQKFKPRIKNLFVDCNELASQNPIINYLDEIQYETLYFKNIDLYRNKITDLKDLDFKISEKCKEIYFINCINYSISLVNSLIYLKNCESVNFNGNVKMDLRVTGMVFCYINIVVLQTLNKLPKLKKISLSEWILDKECLELLSNHEIIELNQVIIKDDIIFLKNCTEVRLSKCQINENNLKE